MIRKKECIIKFLMELFGLEIEARKNWKKEKTSIWICFLRRQNVRKIYTQTII